MDIFKKIIREEIEVYNNLHKRYRKCAFFPKHVIPGARESGYYNRVLKILEDPQFYVGNDKDIRKFTLHFELNNLKEYKLITEKERRKYAKFAKADYEMQNLLGAILSPLRDKRIKKYGYAKTRL